MILTTDTICLCNLFMGQNVKSILYSTRQCHFKAGKPLLGSTFDIWASKKKGNEKRSVQISQTVVL
jgi:hypothetical protein